MVYLEQMKAALHWNDVFENARKNLRWLEGSRPDKVSLLVAEELKAAWDQLTLDGKPHPERLHPDRFGRYDARVRQQLAVHLPVLRLVK